MLVLDWLVYLREGERGGEELVGVSLSEAEMVSGRVQLLVPFKTENSSKVETNVTDWVINLCLLVNWFDLLCAGFNSVNGWADEWMNDPWWNAVSFAFCLMREEFRDSQDARDAGTKSGLNEGARWFVPTKEREREKGGEHRRERPLHPKFMRWAGELAAISLFLHRKWKTKLRLDANVIFSLSFCFSFCCCFVSILFHS